MDNFFLFVQQGAFDEVFSLVDSKLADVNSIDSYGCTALHWAAMNNRLQIAELLLANGADVNKPGGDLREIPIQWTVRNEGLFAMTVLLLQHGSNIQHQNIYGQDSLVLACQAGNVNAAFMMLTNGASPNSFDKVGHSPLTYVLSNASRQFSRKKLHLTRLLLNFGADVMGLTVEGNNPLHCLLLNNSHDTEGNLFIAFFILEAGGDAALSLLQRKNQEGISANDLLAKHALTKGFAFDYKLFKVLPQIFPALCSAVCMLIYPIFLEEFGLYYGFFAVIVLYGIYFQYLRQPTILKHQSRIALGWSIGAILSIAWSHWHACYPHISLVASGLFYVALCLTLTFFFRCIISKPASLTKGDNSDRLTRTGAPSYAFADTLPLATGLRQADPSLEPLTAASSDASKGTGTSKPPLCTACLVHRSTSFTHCKHCDMCIINLDHHCHFINNCVGRGNRRTFVLFTLVTCMLGLISAMQLEWVAAHALCQSDTFISHQVCLFWSHPNLLWIFWLSLLSGVWTGTLGVSQLYMVAVESTTYDMNKNRNVKLDKYCLESKHWRNICLFLQTGLFTVTVKQDPTIIVFDSGSAEAQQALTDAKDAEVEAELKRQAKESTWVGRLTQAFWERVYGGSSDRQCRSCAHCDSHAAAAHTMTPTVVVGTVVSTSNA